MNTKVEDNTRARLVALTERAIKKQLVEDIENEIIELIRPKIKEIATECVVNWDIALKLEQSFNMGEAQLASIVFTEKVMNKIVHNTEVKVIHK